MYKRDHHNKIAQVLSAMNVDLLNQTKCYFGGGTAIVLLLNEYRESVDIDFLCSDQEGYRKLRETVFDNNLKKLFKHDVEILREVKSDQYGIRTVLLIDNNPIQFEIVRESRIKLKHQYVKNLPVPCLTRADLFTETLLANFDRFNDESFMSSDIIDLMIMENHWSEEKNAAISKASIAYGSRVSNAYQKAKQKLIDKPDYLNQCLEKMAITDDASGLLRHSLGIMKSNSLSN